MADLAPITAPIECPGASLEATMATDARDWSTNRRDAWLYGIVCGWSEEEAMAEVAQRHGWCPSEVARLRRLREKFRVTFSLVDV